MIFGLLSSLEAELTGAVCVVFGVSVGPRRLEDWLMLALEAGEQFHVMEQHHALLAEGIMELVTTAPFTFNSNCK